MSSELKSSLAPSRILMYLDPTITMDSHGIERKNGDRKRKAHRKSRKGCRNCRLRRVKCDEYVPECNKCMTFGVSCNYNSDVPDLQMSVSGGRSIKIPQETQFAIDKTYSGLPSSPASVITLENEQSRFEIAYLGKSGPLDYAGPFAVQIPLGFQFDGQCLELLGRFQTRTGLSIGTESGGRVYHREIFKLAFQNQYLLHLVQAATLIHDRYLSPDPTKRTSTETYHMSRAISLFNLKLSSPLRASDGDALWAAASLLGVLAFSSIEGSTPEEAWPLKAPSASDLEWIRIGEGKDAIRSIASPSRPESIFHPLVEEWEATAFSLTTRTVTNLPAMFHRLYNLENLENNPYYSVLTTLAPLLHMEYVTSSFSQFYAFTVHVKGDFKNLLFRKDPRAMLLLAYWYAIMCNSQWWISRRAILECQSILIYLKRHCAEDIAIQALLDFPRRRCGLVID